ncbi:MAG: SDR family NAD(P)-dependent oxidoreductase [Candidatus Manganitrophaceae bacterium]|nr:MAG: SDR family NAD(P)-dependent oxidoreductase [Candidatus Manganitrophaceae bacterium]
MGTMAHLKDQVAIVTGGSSGIGFAVARMALAEGMRVVISARDKEKLSRALSELEKEAPGKDRVIAIPTDVSIASQVDAMVGETISKWNRIDLLVNNAGVAQWSSIEETREADWDRIQAINLKGAFLCTKAVLPAMKRQRSGYIVNISSLAGKEGMAGVAAYSASKFGLVGLTESTLAEAVEHRIRATVICPAYVATPLVAGHPTPTEEMIPPEDIGKIIFDLLHLSPVTVIKEIVVHRRGAID